jgi:hypothetical protein
MNARISLFLGAVLIAVALSSCAHQSARGARTSGVVKYTPGHYVAVGRGTTEEISRVEYLDEPAVKGVSKRYFWRTLEPEKGEYDFSQIESDLEYLEGRGKQLIAFIMDASFTAMSALPPYLSDYDVSSDSGGHSPVRWNPYYGERLIALGNALGEQFDSRASFEGLAVQESSLGITDDNRVTYGYTPEKYRDALIRILCGLQEALPRSHVFWYSNFLPDNNGYLYQIADAIEGKGIYMGGPDILPYRRQLSGVSYPMYDRYKDRLTLFCSAQGDSYRHYRNDTSVDEVEPVDEGGYLTMEEIFLFARDSLHVRYLLWDYEYEGIAQGYRTFDDAIAVIRAYPTFNAGGGPL